MIDVSVIIVSYNVRYFLEQCILSVLAASKNLNVEIIVVDNDSSDGSFTIINEKYPKIKFIQNTENVGFTKANNKGVSVAKGNYILLLNPDTLIAENTLDELVNLYDYKANLGITGVRLIDGAGNFAPESKRGIPSPHTTFNKLFGISGKNTGKYYANHLKDDESGVVDVLSGSFMFLKKDVFNEVGGFDETFFMYGEDIDLSYRVKLKGYSNYYLASTTVIHYKGESTKKDIKYLKHFHKAMDIFYEKHFKLNVIYDLLMKLGIKLWYFTKFFKFKFKDESRPKVEKIQFFEKGEFTMFCSNKKYLLVNNKTEKLDQLENIILQMKIDTLVFDNATISFKSIIYLIEKLKSKGVLFKIHPKGTYFIIGSPNSSNKGDVKLISF